MKLKVNGEEKEFSQKSMNIHELLKVNQVAQPEMVSVQLNGEFVNKADYKTKKIKEGDEVDFLYFMGGGKSLDRYTKNVKKA